MVSFEGSHSSILRICISFTFNFKKQVLNCDPMHFKEFIIKLYQSVLRYE